GPPPTPPPAPAAPAAGAPGTSAEHYGGTRGPPGSGCDSRQATPHPEVLLTSTNHRECHQRPGRVHLGRAAVTQPTHRRPRHDPDPGPRTQDAAVAGRKTDPERPAQNFPATAQSRRDTVSTSARPRLASSAGVIAVIAGIVFAIAGIAVWVLVSTQLSAQRITVGEDVGEAVPALSWTEGRTVADPFTAYAQAEIIDMHASAIAGGNTYAELGALVSEAQDAGDEDLAAELQAQRNTVMNASFLRASLFTSVVSYGVAAVAIVLGIVLGLGGLGLRQVAAAVTITPQRVEKTTDPD